MGKVGAGFSMSLDGFIAGPGDDVGRLFAWMMQGDTDLSVSTGNTEIDLQFSAEDAEAYQDMMQQTGAIVSGRRLFDVAEAWGGKHPMEVPVVVLTHSIPKEWDYEGTPFTFVTEGVEAAVEAAQRIAGDKNVGVGGADITRQCLKLGLLDELAIDLVPVLLGEGVRLFEHLGIEPVELELRRIRTSPGVVHMTYQVCK